MVDSTIFKTLILVMGDAVTQLRKFCPVPSVRRADKIASDALEAVKMRAATLGAFLQVSIRTLISTIHATVPVVVDRAVAHVVLVHQVYKVHDGLRVVRGVAINLDVEDMTSARQLVVWRLDACLMCSAALIVYRHVV